MAIHAEFEINVNRRHPVTLNIIEPRNLLEVGGADSLDASTTTIGAGLFYNEYLYDRKAKRHLVPNRP